MFRGRPLIIKSPDEWATTKQACRDELVVYLSFSSIYIHIYKVAYKLERKTKLLEGPGNLIKTFRPFGLRQLIFF